jgi:hypothetical protein
MRGVGCYVCVSRSSKTSSLAVINEVTVDTFRRQTPEWYVAAATDTEGQRPAIYDDTDTDPREAMC